jgi:hypothetical protein
MLRIKFNGWFHCRLATDPDPADEIRGVSGMMRVFPGEPNLDRIIRFQPPFLLRNGAPSPGVFVKEVVLDGQLVTDHWLVGSHVNLLHNPVFKGDNGIVAEDGKEPIVPFHFEISKNNFRISRTTDQRPGYSQFPYEDLQAQAFGLAPGLIASATGIFDMEKHLLERIKLLEIQNQTEKDPLAKLINEKRINFLKSGAGTAFFNAYMSYHVQLAGPGIIEDPENKMVSNISMQKPWVVDMWFGGWDPDTLFGFTEGYLSINNSGT